MIIDGENGGGQILRTALSFSLLTGMPFKIINIRKNRDKPGLKQQHLTCIKAIEQLYDVKVSEYNIGSKELTFMPKSNKLKTKRLTIDIETAGSITLLLQSIILPLSFSDAKSIILRLKGGTDVPFAMPYDFIKYVLLPHIRYLYKDIDIDLVRHGFYPKGNGELVLKLKPKYENKFYDNFILFQNDMLENKLDIDYTAKGNLHNIKGLSIASKDLQARSVAERQERAARLLLKDLAKTDIRVEYVNTESTGSDIILWARYSIDKAEISELHPIILGANCLGKVDLSAETVGKTAAKYLIDLIKGDAVVDKNVADNLIPFLAIVGGKIKTNEISGHIKANAYVTNEFLKALKSSYRIKIDETKKIIGLEKTGS